MALNEPDLKSRGKLKSTTTADGSSKSIGPTSSDMAISHQSTGPLSNPLTSSAGDFPAKMSAKLEQGEELQGNALDSTFKCLQPFAIFDPATRSWKTSQVCLTGDLATFSEDWPTSGLMRNGECFPRAPWVHHTHGSECFFWHTPTSNDHKPAGQVEMDMVLRHMNGERVDNTYIRLRSQLAARSMKRLPANPSWIEWLMGYPIGFTVSKHSEIASSRKSRKRSGG